MRINGHSVPNLSPSPSEPPTAAEAARRGPSGSGNQSSHTPTSELRAYQRLAHEVPDIRPDRVEEVAEKLASGFYNTPAAAEQTAEAILRGL